MEPYEFYIPYKGEILHGDHYYDKVNGRVPELKVLIGHTLVREENHTYTKAEKVLCSKDIKPGDKYFSILHMDYSTLSGENEFNSPIHWCHKVIQL